MDETVILYTTWPDADTAERAAETVVGEALAACANILGPARSVYRWQGAVERAAEVVMILKTGTVNAGKLRDRLVTLHPYEVPAIVAIPVLTGASSSPFLLWIGAETAVS